MADLAEKQIRNAIVALLTGLTTTGANVFLYRFYSVPDAKLPAIKIYTDEEEIEFDSLSAPRKKTHQLDVRIEVVAKQAANVEDTVALIYQEVITALEADTTLGGLVKDLWNAANQKTINDEGDQPVIGATMQWICQYRTVEKVPDVTVK